MGLQLGTYSPTRPGPGPGVASSCRRAAASAWPACDPLHRSHRPPSVPAVALSERLPTIGQLVISTSGSPPWPPTDWRSTMWTLSGFADEIDPDLNAQCDVLQQLGIGFLELRSAWDVNVLDPTDQQVDGVRRTLAKRGLQVSSIGSPVGKVNIEQRLRRVLLHGAAPGRGTPPRRVLRARRFRPRHEGLHRTPRCRRHPLSMTAARRVGWHEVGSPRSHRADAPRVAVT